MPTPLSLMLSWCTAPADPADIADPGATLKASGWDPGVSVPQGEHLNWLFWACGQLANASGAMRYTDLQVAILDWTELAGTAIEGTFLVDEHDGANAPGTIHTDTDTGQGVTSVSAAGTLVAYCEDGQLLGYAVRRDTTTAVAQYDLTGAATFDALSRIVTDGKYTAVSYGNFVEVFNALTGVSIYQHDHGAQVYDIAMDGTRLYYVGALGVGGTTDDAQACALTLAAGALVWRYRHGAGAGHALYAVASNGRQVFVAGQASDYGSGATIRALDALTGNDATGEGGYTAADTLGLAWDDIQATTSPAYGMTLTTDGASLWCAYGSTAARQIERRGCVDGLVLADAEIAGVNVTCIAVDQRYLLVAHDGADAVIAFDKQTLSRSWRWLDPAGAGVNAVTSDGCAVFVGCDTAARRLARLYRGNQPTIYRRVNVANNHLPYRLQAVPAQ